MKVKEKEDHKIGKIKNKGVDAWGKRNEIWRQIKGSESMQGNRVTTSF